jgi:hypothetical protein
MISLLIFKKIKKKKKENLKKGIKLARRRKGGCVKIKFVSCDEKQGGYLFYV